jgi:ABC-type dipeptide/oligopeptide/nickel transport system permease subunit
MLRRERFLDFVYAYYPHAISPLIVNITMSIGGAVMSGAGLSFIGLGVQSPIAEWEL